MKKLLKHKKALSPVIAAIILIAVTVAVSIAVAAWMGALTIGFMGTEELRITSVTFGADPTAGIKMNVQNTGTASIVINEVRAGGDSGTGTEITLDIVDGATGVSDLPAGEAGIITWSSFGWEYGTAYNVEVITAKGNTFVYRATAPQE